MLSTENKTSMTRITRLFDILDYCKERFDSEKIILAGKEGKTWKEYSIAQYVEYSNLVSLGLLTLGIKKDDKIAIISNSMPEWNFLDMGILQIGAINVPIYPTISEADHKYIINHCDAEYVFISGYDMLRRIEKILPECSNIKKVFTMKPMNGYESLYDIIELGRNSVDKIDLAAYKAAVSPDDLATLIYTSGTTGIPKGVMLTHYNIVSNVMGVAHIPPVTDSAKALSYLPLCHIYERMIVYLWQYSGLGIYYAESIVRIADNLREIKPHIMCSVPRLLEKTLDKILDAEKRLKGFSKWVFRKSVELAERYEYDGSNGWFYEFKRSIADKLVYSKWREALGGNMKTVVSGGAAISDRLSRIFICAGIKLHPGYGLTETSPVIAVTTNRAGEYGIGATGGIMAQVEVKIDTDGEILTKGPSLMKGYYKSQELTDEVIDADGWFHTGDLGRIEGGTLLRIIGRKKAFFKNSFGKYVNPLLVENFLRDSSFIDNAMVVGEGEKYTAALIVPNFTMLTQWCKENNVSYTSTSDIIKSEQVISMFKSEINNINKQLSSTEKVSNFTLLEKEWTVDSGELSAALKVKRFVVAEKYKNEIAEMFK